MVSSSRRDVSNHKGCDSVETPSQSFPALIHALVPLLRGRYIAISHALTAIAVGTVLTLYPPFATKIIIDYSLNRSDTPMMARLLPADKWASIVLLALSACGVSIVGALLHVWGRWQAIRISKLVQIELRRRLLRHILRLPTQHLNHLTPGGVTSIIRTDAGSVGELVFTAMCTPWKAFIHLLGTTCILTTVAPRILLGGLPLVLLFYIMHRTRVHQMRSIFQEVHRCRDAVDGRVAEVIAGIRTVRSLATERFESRRFARMAHWMGRYELQGWWGTRMSELTSDLFVPIITAVILLYGGHQVLAGTLSLGELIMFLTYTLLLLGPLTVLAQSAAQFQNGLACLDRILEVFAFTGDDDSQTTISPSLRPGNTPSLTFHQVSFTYPHTTTFTLRDLSFTVPFGSTVGIVGPNGAGKTTLCSLLARLSRPSDGTISLGGADIQCIPRAYYRSLVSVAHQTPYLFTGSVAFNIAYGDRHPSRAAVRRAAAIAGIAEFIESLPHRYDTYLGQNGHSLSGGQKQRLALARALYRDPELLVLDEPTSQLDGYTENCLLQSLQAWGQRKTCLVITHRLSTLTLTDFVLVMRNGGIVATGQHEHLLMSCHDYRELFAHNNVTACPPLAADTGT